MGGELVPGAVVTGHQRQGPLHVHAGRLPLGIADYLGLAAGRRGAACAATMLISRAEAFIGKQ